MVLVFRGVYDGSAIYYYYIGVELLSLYTTIIYNYTLIKKNCQALYYYLLYNGLYKPLSVCMKRGLFLLLFNRW